MTTDTFEQFKTWVTGESTHFEITFHGLRPSFGGSEVRFLKFAYPTHPSSVAYCANLSATLSSTYYDRAHFDGAYLWFADEPFSQWEQAAGRVAIDRIRAGFGDLRPFDFAYVYKFRSDEIELLTTFVILAIVLLWDVYILTGWGDRIVHISHDGLFGVYAKDTETKLRINEAFPESVLGEYPK